jgi:hypothetical protein
MFEKSYREAECEGHEGVEPAVELLLVPQRLQLQVVVVRAGPKVLHVEVLSVMTQFLGS